MRELPICAALALIPLPVLAATPPDIVVTASRAEQDVSEVGQAITVIDRATIVSRQEPAVSDLLATTPGISVSRTGGIGAQTSVRIRGAESAQTLVVIDGVRVNDPSDPSGAYDFGNLLTAGITRIEVLRGPNAVAWGSQAIGGVVDITTAAPAEALTLNARASYGDLATFDSSVSAATAVGPFRLRLGGAYYKTDGISAVAAGSERDGYEHYGGSARVDAAISDSVALDFRGYWTRSNLGFDDGFALADSDDRSRVTQADGYAALKVDAFGGALRNRLAVSVADVNRDYRGSFEFQAHGRTDRIEYGGDARIASWVRAIFGLENERSRLRTFDAFSGEDRRSTRIGSAYGQLVLTPVKGLSVTGGLRHDDHRQFGGHTSFGANAAFTVAHTTIRSSYAEGFKAPTLSQLYGFGGDPRLQPETAQSVDVGVEHRFLDGRLKIGATWFERRSRNLIVSDPATFQLSNIARSFARGEEVEIAASPSDTVQFSANYTHLRSVDKTPGSANFGRDLQYRPRDILSGSIDWRHRLASVGATIRLVGDSFNDRANRRPLDGYAVVDLRATLNVARSFELFGRIGNVLDARYETVADYGTLGRNAHVGASVQF